MLVASDRDHLRIARFHHCHLHAWRDLRHQQDLAALKIAILVLPTTSWPRLQRITREIAAAAGSLKPGQYHEVAF